MDALENIWRVMVLTVATTKDWKMNLFRISELFVTAVNWIRYNISFTRIINVELRFSYTIWGRNNEIKCARNTFMHVHIGETRLFTEWSR